jgi:hypothetical protein
LGEICSLEKLGLSQAFHEIRIYTRNSEPERLTARDQLTDPDVERRLESRRVDHARIYVTGRILLAAGPRALFRFNASAQWRSRNVRLGSSLLVILGAEGGNRTLKSWFSKWLMARVFWQQRLVHHQLPAAAASPVVLAGRREPTPVVATSVAQPPTARLSLLAGDQVGDPIKLDPRLGLLCGAS